MSKYTLMKLKAEIGVELNIGKKNLYVTVRDSNSQALIEILSIVFGLQFFLTMLGHCHRCPSRLFS